MRRPMMTAAMAAIVLALGGCAADAYYEQGQKWEMRDPSAAAEYYRLALAEDPAHSGARMRVQDFDFYGPYLDDAKGAEGRKDWQGALRAYERAAEVSFILKAIGGRMPDDDLVARHENAMREAAAQRYDAGQNARNQGDDAAATRAFRECLALDPTHREALAAYKEAHARAVRRVGIVPFDADAPGDKPLARELADATIAHVDRRRPEMIELVTRTNLEQVLLEHDLSEMALVDPATQVRSGKLLGLHIVVTARLSPIETGDTGWVEERGHNEVDKVEAGAAKTRISADWVVRTRTTRATATLNVQAIDVETGAVLMAERVVRERTSRTRHARKTAGEDAALPNEIAQLCREREVAPASGDVLAKELVPILAEASGDAVVGRLR